MPIKNKIDIKGKIIGINWKVKKSKIIIARLQLIDSKLETSESNYEKKVNMYFISTFQ